MAGRLLFAMLLCAAAPATAQTAVIAGVLVNRDGRRPIEGVRVAVLGTAIAASTDSNGGFELAGVPPGVRVLQARAIGYAVASWLIDLGDGQLFRDTFDLEPRIVALAAVDVTGDARDWRSEAGFEQRRLRGVGHFVTREDIQQRNASNLAELLRQVPGLFTVCSTRTCTVTMMRATTTCQPEYFLDGHPATNATGSTFPINPAAIRGVEIYRTQFEVPAEFQKINLRCGVIAIWTIDPGERFDGRR